MAYMSKWEPIGETAARLTLRNPHIKRDLCRALGDGAIEYRVHLAADPQLGWPATVLSNTQFAMPARMLAESIDWEESRPKNDAVAGTLRPLGMPISLYWKAEGQFIDKKIECIEIHTVDVERVFGQIDAATAASVSQVATDTRGEPPGSPVPSDMDSKSKDQVEDNPRQPNKPLRRPGAKMAAVIKALDALSFDDIPRGLTKKDLQNKIRDYIKEHDLSMPADLPKMVQRALKIRTLAR